MKDDRHWMRRALELARQAADEGEVPVGAILVRAGELAGSGYNQVERTGDPLAHAEMLAFRQALSSGERRALQDCTLYVTLEPCTMCVGAAILARIPRLVFGTREPKTGACESLFSIPNEPALEHRMAVVGGVEADRCRELLQDFFKRRRSGEDHS
jgi:tRNA(adenine34) deaminase